MAESKPFVAIACVCEKVLLEPDQVPSVIRIVDTFTVVRPTLPAGIQWKVPLTAFVALKSGPVTGEHEVGLSLRDPGGKRVGVRKWPVVLAGQEHGANVKIEFALENPPEGLFWFDVLWGEEVLTSIPFRLTFAETKPQTGSPKTL